MARNDFQLNLYSGTLLPSEFCTRSRTTPRIKCGYFTFRSETTTPNNLLGKVFLLICQANCIHHISAMPRYSSAAVRALSSPGGTATQNDEESNMQALRDLLEQGLDQEEEDDDDDASDSDEEEKEREVTAVFGANILSTTRYGYRRSQGKFAAWIYQQAIGHSDITKRTTYCNLLHPDLFAALEEESLKEKPNTIEQAITFISRASAEYHPIRLTDLTARQFILFLLSFTPTGVFKSRSFYGGYSNYW